MSPVRPDASDLAVLRAIASEGCDRATTARVCCAAGWELVAEDDDVRMLQYKAVFGDSAAVVVTVHRGSDDEMTPAVSAPLAFFLGNVRSKRAPYDRAFRSAADHLGAILGPATAAGEYPSSEAPHRSLLYCWWRLQDAAVVLVQNEFGPPSPPDVSLWVFPPRDEIRLPVTEN
jgi:hypothetical protein